MAEEGDPDGPVLIMLHGVPGGHRDYRYLAPAIAAQGIRCVRVELPQFGANVHVAPHRDYSSRGRGKLLVDVADALDAARFSVLGHSLGGSATLAAAAMAPERVASLSLLASVGVSKHKGLPASPWMIRLVASVARLPVLWPRAARAIKAQYKRLRFAGVDAMTDAEIWVHARCVWAQSFRENRRHAAAVRCPSLVAFADDDRMIEPAIGVELSEALGPMAQVARFPDGGHALQKARAAELGPMVADVIRRGAARPLGSP